MASAPPVRTSDGSFARQRIFIEEPEANIFPSTQYELAKLFGYLGNNPHWDFSWTITTHSPYILSAFNNLIYAGQLGQDSRLREKLPIEEKFWITPGSFRAYKIEDGKTSTILSKSGLVDGAYLDSVSDAIGDEFDSMLRLDHELTSTTK